MLTHLCTDKLDERNMEEFNEKGYSEAEFCSNSEVMLGVLCKKCILRSDWCKGSPSVCGSINTDSDVLCSNYTFWRTHPALYIMRMVNT